MSARGAVSEILSKRAGRHARRQARLRAGMAAGALLALVVPQLVRNAQGIPVFARRYNQSCKMCHAPIPRLNETGERTAGNGFRLAPGETAPDAMNGGDDMLALPKIAPFAVRVDGRMSAEVGEGDLATDFRSPWVMKVLSSSALGRNLSYYFYFLMSEGGEVVGAEDAFLVWNDVGGVSLDLNIGQFSVSDPIFKRELRLPVDDYHVYRMTVGEQVSALSYDRGVMAIGEYAGTQLTVSVLNGNGLPGAADGRYDDDREKNLFGHVTRDVTEHLRLGALGYTGRQRHPSGERNTLWMAGADATVAAGPWELNVQYLHREDDEPTFTPGERRAVVDGGFAELLLLPEGSRAYGYALYNRIEDNRGLIDLGDAAPGRAQLYETVSIGAGYLVQRNARVYGEFRAEPHRELGRATLGFTIAY